MLKELFSLAGGEVVAAGKRKIVQFELYAAAALCALVAAFFALDGVHTMLAASYGQVAASFMIAGGMLVVAALIVGAALILKSRRPPVSPLATAAMVAAPVALSLLAPSNGRRAGASGGLLGALLGRP